MASLGSLTPLRGIQRNKREIEKNEGDPVFLSKKPVTGWLPPHTLTKGNTPTSFRLVFGFFF